MKNVNDLKPYTETIIWTGVAAPSGNTNHTYESKKAGDKTIVKINLRYEIWGTNLTEVLVQVPPCISTIGKYIRKRVNGSLKDLEINTLI